MDKHEIIKASLKLAQSLYDKDLKIGSLFLSLNNEPTEFLFQEIDEALLLCQKCLGIEYNETFMVAFFDCVFDKVNIDTATLRLGAMV